MEIVKYLNDNFYTRQELLDISKVSESDLAEYQRQGFMPACSYRLNLDLSSDSFFGLHQEKHEIEYFSKGYTSWLGIIQSLKTADAIYTNFSRRYIDTIDFLKDRGHSSTDPKVNSGIESHVEEEWKYFLDGTYGLCTKSGLPEDIAAKEFAILEINELSTSEQLTSEESERLIKAVNLLDTVSSMFAPHERIKSARHRLINEIRRKYKLQS